MFNYNLYYEDEERQKELLEERESLRQMYITTPNKYINKLSLF